MAFKSFIDDQTVLQCRYYYFHTPRNVDGEGFLSQISTLKTVPSDKKSNCHTCAEGCQMPFNYGIYKQEPFPYILISGFLLQVKYQETCSSKMFALSLQIMSQIAKVPLICLHYFPAAILVSFGGTPTWRLHTGLCKSVQNISTNI